MNKILYFILLLILTPVMLWAQMDTSQPAVIYKLQDFIPLFYIALVTILFLRVWYLWNRDSKGND